MLKRQVGEIDTTSIELPPIANDGEIIMEPKVILDTRWVKKGSNFLEENLVQWKNLPKEDATWENTQELRNKFIKLNIEDKVPLKERGNDKPRRSTKVPIKNPRYEDWVWNSLHGACKVIYDEDHVDCKLWLKIFALVIVVILFA